MSAQLHVLRLGAREFELGSGTEPLLMGVVNASPDSFSDAGRHVGLEAQVALAHELSEAGAGLIDVGGESGVTDRRPVGARKEAARVVPLVERLTRDGLAVSVDTWKAEVARRALEAGAVMVNDPSGLCEPALAEACAATGAGLVVTHTRARPKHKEFPAYDDVVEDVCVFLSRRVALATRLGVPEDRILVDPGPDLGKTPADTVAVVAALAEIRARAGRPLLLAVSRKDFLGAITGRPPRERLAATLAAVATGLDAGADLLRVHDVAEVRDFIAVRSVLRGEAELPAGARLAPDLQREEPAA